MSKVVKTKIGTVTISRNLLLESSQLKWCVREIPKGEIDTGWVFLAESDSEEFLADKNNWCIVPFEVMIEKEPAILSIFNCPIGSDLTLVINNGKRYFIDSKTGKTIS